MKSAMELMLACSVTLALSMACSNSKSEAAVQLYLGKNVDDLKSEDVSAIRAAFKAIKIPVKIHVISLPPDVSKLGDVKSYLNPDGRYLHALVPPFRRDGFWWIGGFTASLCGTPSTRYSISNWSSRARAASLAAAVHEIGHLFGAPHSGNEKDVMHHANSGTLEFSRRSALKIRECLGLKTRRKHGLLQRRISICRRGVGQEDDERLLQMLPAKVSEARSSYPVGPVGPAAKGD